MNKYFIPGAIVVAGLLVAGSVLLGGGGPDSQNNHGGFGNNNSPSAENVRPIDETDHILGNPDAEITIVEYSDFECPFCGRLHPTLEQVVEDNPSTVKWVYRHFPLSSIHFRALDASVASECAAELGGNEAFWTFTNELFVNQQNLGEELYANTAAQLGIDGSAFEQCLDDDRHKDRVTEDRDNALESGGTGTPYVIVINGNGDVFPFSGALPAETIQGIIDQALAS